MPAHIVLGIALASAVAVLTMASYGSPDPEPSPDLTVTEVVRVQVEALQDGDDAGIAAAFRFASPGNRAATGPLARFTVMIRQGYGDMLGFERAEYGRVTLRDDVAAQEVTFVQADGRAATYGFVLSRQSSGPCEGCWMTDAVVPLDGPSGGGTRV